MIKVAFVTPGAYPVPSVMGGSVERVVEKVVPLLVPNVDTRVYGRIARRLPSREWWKCVSFERFPASDKAAYFRQVCRRLAVYRPDIIQVENRPLWVPRLKKLFPDSEIWLNLHSATFISAPYATTSQRRICLVSADRIVVNSHFLGSYVAGKVPAAEGKISVNHLGVDAARFPDRFDLHGSDMRETARSERGWSDRKIVLYVGRLIPQKGIHHLLAALPRIVQEHPDALLVIVGGTQYGSRRGSAYKRKLLEMARPWRKHVHFEPYVSHTQIPEWFALADAGIVPSVGKEAFGLVNVEAMATGLPVIATRAGGMKEIIVDGVTGYLISPNRSEIVAELADTTNKLLSDEELRLSMGRRGRERVIRQFTWEHTAQRWLGLLEL